MRILSPVYMLLDMVDMINLSNELQLSQSLTSYDRRSNTHAADKPGHAHGIQNLSPGRYWDQKATNHLILKGIGHILPRLMLVLCQP